MTWRDIDLHPPDRVLRQFAAAWLVVVGGLAIDQWLRHGNAGIAVLLGALAVAVGAIGLLRPQAVRLLFIACTVAAFPLGWVVSQAMLIVLFFGLVTPVAMLFALIGRDRLARRRPHRDTYWKPKTTPEDVRRYLRQY